MIESLGDGSELWVEPSTRPDYAEWESLARKRGDNDPDPDSIGYHMTRTLIYDLLFAAGGVETELLRLHDALGAAQEWTNWARQQIPRDESVARGPEYREGTGAPSLLDAHYAFWNLLAWTRAVQERIDRPYKPGSKDRAGLLPAVAPAPLRTRIHKALNTFRDRTKDTRYFANYVLHSGAIPGGGSPRAEVEPDGHIWLRLPDPPTNHITTWEEFEFTQRRDMVKYAEDLMEAVAQTIDEILAAFADHVPERFRTTE